MHTFNTLAFLFDGVWLRWLRCGCVLRRVHAFLFIVLLFTGAWLLQTMQEFPHLPSGASIRSLARLAELKRERERKRRLGRFAAAGHTCCVMFDLSAGGDSTTRTTNGQFRLVFFASFRRWSLEMQGNDFRHDVVSNGAVRAVAFCKYAGRQGSLMARV